MPIGSPPDYVRAEFDADMSVGTEIVLRSASGAARVLGATETFVLVAGSVSSLQEDAEITIFADADNDNAVDAGERLVSYKVSAESPHASFYFGPNGIYGAIGALPHVISAGADGTVTGTLVGYIAVL